jgi:peptidoglycan/LPS O-acetylase OafA/YrhL
MSVATRLEGLTFPRFVAALVVVLYHFGQGSLPTRLLPGVCASGPQMVTFFFVLSGFVMYSAYAGRPELPARTYWHLRIARLLPVYLLALGLTWMLAPTARSWPGAVLSVALLQAWIPGWATTVNFPGWSLSVEAAFYAIFPWLLRSVLRSRHAPGRLLAVALVVWALTQAVHVALLNSGWPTSEHSLIAELVRYFPLSHANSFALGVTGAHWQQTRRAPLGGWWPRLAIPLLTLGCIGALEAQTALTRWSGIAWPFETSWWAPLFLLLVLALARGEGIAARVLAWRPLVLLGEASYGMYILHYPIYVLHHDWVVPMLGLHGAPVHYVYALLLIGLSLAVFRWIETPCRRWLRPRGAAA